MPQLLSVFLSHYYRLSPRRHLPSTSVPRSFAILVVLTSALILGGCSSLPGVRRKVTVPQLLAPQATADTNRLLQEVNKLAAVKSLRGKVDVQFLDTSFAKCGIAEKYATADGEVVLQRPGNVNLKIQVPFVGTDVAQMTSDGAQFRVAVLQGDEKFRRFVRGTNNAQYERLAMNESDADCGDDNKRERAATQQRAVGALSGLRPQHFTDALLIRPAAQPGDNFIYTQSEYFQEEADDRPASQRANKKSSGGRVIRSYYLLEEIAAPTALGGGGNSSDNTSVESNNNHQAKLVRRFWFDRYQGIRLARLQTFDEQGQLTTDVIYRDPKPFGGNTNNAPQAESILDTPNAQALAAASNNTQSLSASVILPSRIEVTRPQDRYSIRITYQTPESVVLNRPYNDEVFVLRNEWKLPEVDLDRSTVRK